MLTAPLATMAVGAGFWAQSLTRPALADRDVLEALIAQPSHATATPSSPAKSGTGDQASGSGNLPNLPPTLPAPAPSSAAGSTLSFNAAGSEAAAARMVGRLRSPRIAAGSSS
jgi:hypothetical protein